MKKHLSLMLVLIAVRFASATDFVIGTIGGGSVVTNTITNTLLAATGQTNSFAGSDDGALQLGNVWPVPRFTVLTNTNCVLDNLTGLIWAQNSRILPLTNFAESITNCTTLEYGGETDWRCPNICELLSLIDWGNTTTVKIKAGHPFWITANQTFWSSTTLAGNTAYGEPLNFGSGNLSYAIKTTAHGTWPVRGP